jgi:prepilin-type N-terminal cleavage/methylation domain-containing protein
MNKIKSGFTLLELLVVIGIIGILVALATVSYSATQRSGRDSRRKQDMVAIQNALEQYYSDAANSFNYPTGRCSNASAFMKSAWPTDPDGTAPYTYSEDCTTGSSYCVCARMEKDGTGNANDVGCTFGGTKNYYCVGNLQ